MRLLPLLALTTALGSAAAIASDPGQPLDCSNWVFVEPGFSCEPLSPWPCQLDDPFCNEVEWRQFPTDNESFFYELRTVTNVVPPCQAGGIGLNEVRLVRIDTQQNETIIGYLRERCFGLVRDRSETCTGTSERFPPCLYFDSANGRMLVKTKNSQSDPIAYGDQVFLIRGFTTALDVLQSYEPTPAIISFRVPYMPEGFPSADWFDTYYGDLAMVGDWSQAQALECAYPVSMPSAGDYLTVDDPLPNPAPGQGRYYVTAVTYQGQRRYGRKAMGGVLSGRDPGVLPACVE